jgi:hypothetical protein
MLGLETMDPALRTAYAARMKMPPSERLEREVFETNPLWTAAEREAHCLAFAQRIAECDVRAHPMAAAINSVLSHPSLGQTNSMPLGRADLLKSSSEIRHPYEDYVVAYRVPNIRLRQPSKADELVSLGHFFQRLSIRRSAATPRLLQAIDNYVRPSLTALHQLSCISAVARGPVRRGDPPAPIDTWNKTPRYFSDLDFDFIAAVSRHESLGSRVETPEESKWRAELQIAAHEPLMYAPNRIKLGRMLRICAPLCGWKTIRNATFAPISSCASTFGKTKRARPENTGIRAQSQKCSCIGRLAWLRRPLPLRATKCSRLRSLKQEISRMRFQRRRRIPWNWTTSNSLIYLI